MKLPTVENGYSCRPDRYGQVAFDAAWKQDPIAGIVPVLENGFDQEALAPAVREALRRQHAPR